MKIISFNAISLNGKVASLNNEEEFISDVNWNEFCSLVNRCGFLIWSRKTNDVVKSWDKKYLKKIKAKIVTVSRNKKLGISLEDAIDLARKQGFKEIVVTSGPIMNKYLWKNNLIDELILDIEPVIVGRGKNLIEEVEIMKRLKIRNVKEISGGVVQIKYGIKK